MKKTLKQRTAVHSSLRSSLRCSALAMMAASMFCAVSAQAQTSQNLVVNGNAEAGACTNDWSAVTTVPGWNVISGNPSIACYSIASFSTPNSAANGNAFFADGPYGDSSMSQTVNLASAASAIDGGSVTFNLSAWLGGYTVYSGAGVVTVTFYNAAGQALSGGTQLSGDTPTARGSVNKFLATSGTGYVPVGARSAQVLVQFVNTTGVTYNVGYADNISLTLSTPVTPAVLTPPVSAVPAFDHVFMVMMENTSYNQVIGNTSSAPFINSLANQGTLLANYSGVYHPSDENYMAIAGGNTFVQGAIYFPNIKVTSKHLGDQLEAVGKTWKAYEQGMGSPCNLTTNNDKYYEPDDAPFINFTNISGNPTRCAAHLFDTTQLTTDLASAATTPNFSWIAADDYYDGEASGNGSTTSLQTQDGWLKQTLQPIFNSPAWKNQRSLLILTWDESSVSGTNHVGTILVGSNGLVNNTISNTSYNHYSVGRTIESALGIAPMTANDQYATPINDAFVVAPAVTLTASTTSISSSGSIAFNYSAPPVSQNSTNWIGIYPAGAVPGSGSSTTWQYVPNPSGQATFSGLSAGSYFAEYFYNGGYTALSAPVAFTVTP
ncbi:alkaline phosphatase family protein [Solimicrobium silvestre]|uniref:Phosphoesterase family n=1 Tax=Solimicrobium silvestre TaxID=2099400 RepID=A0A2S9GUM2_9BURK|nr:alkaline phosphatase family protein [Solimicrobium silvestre]PRC91401.1 Phosphoesterase family [Solimicrobium silvestre]